MLKKMKIIGTGLLASTAMVAGNAHAQAQGAFDSFVTNISGTGEGIGEIVSVIAYTLAGIMFLIAGWNMYKKSKNPNGNEGAIILGAVIAGSILLAIPTVANIGQDGLFGGGTQDADNINFGTGIGT
jgi:hypothetical protein